MFWQNHDPEQIDLIDLLVNFMVTDDYHHFCHLLAVPAIELSGNTVAKEIGLQQLSLLNLM